MNVDEKNKRVQTYLDLPKMTQKVFFYLINKSKTKKQKWVLILKIMFLSNYMNKQKIKNFIKNENLHLVTPYVDKRTNICHSTFYSISSSFEALLADIADLRFLAKSAVDPKYCLLIVDLFTSKIYVYLMKNRGLLAKMMELFYNDIQPKRTGKIRLQTNLEFNQNKIKTLNKKSDVEMFHTKIRGGKHLRKNKKLESLKKYY